MLDRQLKALLEKEGGIAWEDTGKEIPQDYPFSYRFDPLHTTHVVTTTLNFPEYASCIDPQADGVWDPEKLKEKAVCVSVSVKVCSVVLEDVLTRPFHNVAGMGAPLVYPRRAPT